MPSTPHALATAPMRTTPLALCRFNDVHDTWPKQRDLPWPAFAEELREHDRRRHKDGACFTPGRYPFGTRRGSRSVEAVSALTLDFDETEPPWALLEEAGLTFGAYTTWSHGLRDERHPIGAPRWRLVVPLAEDVPAARWPGVYARALQVFRGADPSCRDASRLHYLPACPLDAPLAPETRSLDTGYSLVTDSLPPLPPTARTAAASGQRWAAQLLREGAPQGSRNAGCFRLAAFLLHFGLPEDVIEAICAAYGRRCRPPMDEAEVQTVVVNVCRRYEPGQEPAW